MPNPTQPDLRLDDSPQLTILALLRERASRSPDAIAISAPGRNPMGYGMLLTQVDRVVEDLRASGLSPNNAIAVVLPNGPEMAVTFLAVSAACICAPLNPAYRSPEFEFYFADLNAKALLVQSGSDSPAIATARKLSLPIIELTPQPKAAAGSFTLHCNTIAETRAPSERNGDTALVLHTSGTTSRPKQVPLSQAQLLASARNIAATLQLTENDRCLNVMPLFHIHGLVGALLSSLYAGASVVCSPDFEPEEFLSLVDRHQPTWYTAVPTIHQAVLQAVLSGIPKNREKWHESSLRLIRSSSAPFGASLMQQLEDVFQVPVIQAYGMTEGAHQIASNPLPPYPRKPGSVGLPVGTEVAVLDDAGRFRTDGQTGEIVIRGATVISSYGGNPDDSNDSFLEGWLRTGDQGFIDSDGYVFLTGRLRETINRGGEKLSPFEIDEVLKAHPAVSEAVAFAVPHVTLGQDVAAAIVLRAGHAISEFELQRFAATRLSEFKIPRQIFIVASIPRTATGKVQRIGLDRRLHITKSVATAPRNDVETQLAEIWSQVLGVAVGVHDEFFQLGGDSICATRIVSRIRASMGVELHIDALFETPTIAAIAGLLTPSTPKHATIDRSFLAEGDVAPIACAQEGIWFFDQWNPGNPAYNRPIFLELCGNLNGAALERALNEIVHRHAILHSNFPTIDGQPALRLGTEHPLKLVRADIRSLNGIEPQVRMRDLANQEAQRPFDLAQGPLFRATLIQIEEARHLLLMTTHHMVFDGWSAEVLFSELRQLYAAFCRDHTSPLPELPFQFSDYVIWQRNRIQTDLLKDDLEYWKNQLELGWPSLSFPSDRPAPMNRTFQGEAQYFEISEALTEKLNVLGHSEGASTFMVLLATFAALLHRYTGQLNNGHERIVVGVPFAGRNTVETESLIGCFINTLPIGTDMSGDPTCREFLARVRTVVLEAHSHQALPFESVLSGLPIERHGNAASPFQVLFQLRDYAAEPGGMGELTTQEYLPKSTTALVDLSIAIRSEGNRLGCRIEYSTDLFEAATIDRMFRHWQTLLEGLVAHPDSRISLFPILTDEERHQLIVSWNETRMDYPRDKCIHELFEAQVERTPNATAVVFQTDQLTYKDLNRRSNQLAHYLIENGVGPESLVGICMERSLDMVVGLLGILKAGGAYVPLDPAYPKERLEFMLTDSGASVLLAQEGLFEEREPRLRGDQCSTIRPGVMHLRMDKDWEYIAKESEANPARFTTASNLAYVIYTSGSTGAPKGVAIEHRNTVAFLSWVHSAFTKEDLSVVLASTSTCFDLSVFEIFGPLTCGGTIVVAENALALTTVPEASRVTLLNTVPSAMNELLRLGAIPASVQMINLGGEPLRNDLVQRIYESTDVRKVNDLYGPTECTTYSTWACRTAHGRQTIGRPIANTQVYILDSNLQPVPMGITGEIYIGGDGVARGYLNRLDLSAERFIPNPFGNSGTRLYKTGDLARYRSDGNIEYLGRLDYQLKVRGFRIEPGEVESALAQHPSVRETAVDVREDPQGNGILVAYIATREAAPSIRDLRHFLKETLPEYMVPSSFVFMETLPRTPSGKTDRNALPHPDGGALPRDRAFAAPRNAVEQILVRTWENVLHRDGIGIDDNFFDLGGHSLLATQVISRLRQELNIELPLRRIFEFPTVASLAECIATIRWAGQKYDPGSNDESGEREELTL
jgi:amino acid adenylation domain-containing protein